MSLGIISVPFMESGPALRIQTILNGVPSSRVQAFMVRCHIRATSIDINGSITSTLSLTFTQGSRQFTIGAVDSSWSSI